MYEEMEMMPLNIDQHNSYRHPRPLTKFLVFLLCCSVLVSYRYIGSIPFGKIAFATSHSSKNKSSENVETTTRHGFLDYYQNAADDADLIYNDKTASSLSSKSNKNTTTVQRIRSKHNISIVVLLGGEMGNHLSKVAFAYTIQLKLLQKYNIASHLILRHQNVANKWIAAKRDVQKCFPYFRSLNFSAGNTEECKVLRERQQQAIQNSSLLHNPTDEGLEYFHNLLQSGKFTTTDIPITDSQGGTPSITFPFLITDGMVSYEHIDKYYHEILSLFKFDHTSCCAQFPYEDEAVFTELPKVGQRLGFTELPPNLAANELFAHLKPGSKVAIASRYIPGRNNSLIDEYVEAFQQRGMHVRLTSNENKQQTGVQDFCFLLSSQSNLGGSGRSTFFKWAVWLGNETRRTNWIYHIDNKYTRKKRGFDTNTTHEFQYNWTYHPELQSTIRFKTFQYE